MKVSQCGGTRPLKLIERGFALPSEDVDAGRGSSSTGMLHHRRGGSVGTQPLEFEAVRQV